VQTSKISHTVHFIAIKPTVQHKEYYTMMKKTQHPDSVQKLSNAMIINDNDVSLIAQPKSLFKIIRMINQWIENLVHYYDDKEVINDNQTWYLKWKALYPIIRSSKRSVIEIYRFITEDLLMSNATVLDVLNHFIDTIPELKNFQEITSIDDTDINPDYLQYTLQLYYVPYQDPNNRYADAVTSSDKNEHYRPFTDNQSIMTWNTVVSLNSTSSVPEVVTTEEVHNSSQPQLKDPPKNPTNENVMNTPLSEDTQLSYSDTKLTPNALLPSKDRKEKLNKKSDDLKAIIASSCRQEIGKEMKNVKDDIDLKMDNLKLSMEDAISSNHVKLEDILNTAMSNPTVHHHRPNVTIPSHYKKNQPSPRPSKTRTSTFDFQTSAKNDELPSKVDANFGNNPMQRAFQKSGTLLFHYSDDVYELRDGDFNKLQSKFTPITTKSDLIIFYKQLHGMAITHNIFLTPFDQLVPWDKNPNSITPTCMFTDIHPEDNTVDAYRRMKSALFHKLTQATFHNQEYKAILDHGKTDQDGFDILYDLMTLCHPKLVAITNKYRNVNEKPTFDRNDSIYSYCNKLHSWLDIETINNHRHTEDDIINIVLEQLRPDTRYDKAVESITQQLTFNDTFQRQLGTVIFPEGLKLRNLPGTIMSYYSTEEKADLFPTDTSTSTMNMLRDDTVVNAIINSMGSKPSYARESVDLFCPGCGQHGHSVFQSGCDFCAKHLLVTEFFKKFSNMKPKVIEKFKDHQIKIKAAKKERNKSSGKPKKRFNPRQYKATVNLLADMMESLDESSTSDSDEFQDANEDANEDTNEDQASTSSQQE
jgi:hypothetical protein